MLPELVVENGSLQMVPGIPVVERRSGVRGDPSTLQGVPDIRLVDRVPLIVLRGRIRLKGGLPEVQVAEVSAENSLMDDVSPNQEDASILIS